MSLALAQGIYTPPTAQLTMVGTVFRHWPVTAQVLSIRKYAGAAIGTAEITFPAKYVQDVDLRMGKIAYLRIGGAMVFRGVVGDGPFDVDVGQDQVRLALFDDKWRMTARIVGQAGIGTQGTLGADGFKDVGFEVVFNRDGRPNKDPDELEFNTGSSAVYWTLGTIVQFLFSYYVRTDVARVSAGDLSTAYNRVPNHFEAYGMDALQAITRAVEMSGESWGLIHGSSYSSFQPVRPNAGTARYVRLFPVKGGARAQDATVYHARRVTGGKTIKDSRDLFQAVSAPIVKEITYSNQGDDPLLTGKALFADPEYYVRYSVDVTKYAANFLGANLSSGSRPKPILQQLVTRLNDAGSAYLTAAEIASAPALASAQRIQKPLVWVCTEVGTTTARLCTGGMRLDCEAGTLDFKQTIQLMPDSGEEPEDVTITSWANAGVWLTCATVLESRQLSETTEHDEFLPESYCRLIQNPDLVPERRLNVRLPDLSGGPNATVIAAESEDNDEELYVDVTDRLDEVVAAAIAASPSVETPLDIEFGTIPDMEIGDHILLRGRNLGQSGKEVVVEIRYAFQDGVPNACSIIATNVTAGVDPSKFVEAA